MSKYTEEAREGLSFVAEAKDDVFPNFLFSPMFNDFGDDYYSKSFASDELTKLAKKLRHRYSDYFDYIEACKIYNDYMDRLIEKYGGERVIKNAIEADVLDEAVPAKPKLKRNRKNKQLLRSGVLPSEKVDVYVPDEQMLAIARQVFPETNEEISEHINFQKLPKDERKRIRTITERMSGQLRRENMYRSTGSSYGTDFIVEYLNQAKRGQYSENGEYTGTDDMSLQEIVDETEYINNTPPELLEDESDSKTTIMNGRLIYQKDYQRIQIYKELALEGLDVIGNFGKSMGKQAVKMIRSEIGDNTPMTKKELNKAKKRARKEQKMIERRRDNDALLSQTLLGNKFDGKFNGKDNLSFNIHDIFRDKN